MLDNLQEKFVALSQREKIIVVAMAAVGFWFAWDTFFFQPLEKKQQTLQKELSSLKQQLTEQQLKAINLENSSHINPNQDNKNKLDKLKAESNHQQELIMQGDKSFVPPHLMASALNDILKQNKQLTLIKLETLPVTTLLDAKKPQDAKQPLLLQQLPLEHTMYQHGLTITFAGSYLDTLNYLKALEALSWRIVWESIDYQVKDYPIAETTIRVYTLSFKENWLAV